LAVDCWSSQAYHGLRERCPEMVDNKHRAKLPENPTIIILSGQNCQLING
jgi:hypothetical protein